MRVARRCARFARALALRTLAPVHLLGHSLGGLVIYRMFELGLLQADRFSGDFCRVVLLGSPVHGSQSGRALAKIGPAAGAALLGRAGRDVLMADERRRWPFSAQLGTIAGNRSPRTRAVSSPASQARTMARWPCRRRKWRAPRRTACCPSATWECCGLRTWQRKLPTSSNRDVSAGVFRQAAVALPLQQGPGRRYVVAQARPSGHSA